MRVVLLTSLVTHVIAIYDITDAITNTTEWWKYSVQIRGLMANKNQLSIYLFLLMPLNIYSFLAMKRTDKIVAAINLSLLLAEILVIRTRGVWMALMATAIVWLMLGVYRKRAFQKDQIRRLWKKYRYRVIGSAGIIILLGTMIVKTPAISRYIATSFSDIQNIEQSNNRLRIWQSTLQMGSENMWLGVGAGNWKIELPEYYTLKEGETYKNWRRPHNDYLWIFSEKGLPGVALYLMFFLFLLIYSLRLKNSLYNNNQAGLLFFSFLVGYLAIAFVSFPYERITHQTFVFLFASILFGLYIKEKQHDSLTFHGIWQSYLLIGIHAAILIFAIYYGYRAYSMEHHVGKAIQHKNQHNWEQCIRNAHEAYHPLTRLTPKSAPVQWYSAMGYYARGAFKEALSQMRKAYRLQPHHPYILAQLGGLELYFNQTDQAIRHLEETLKKQPNHSKTLMNLSIAYYKKKQYRKAWRCATKVPPDVQNKTFLQYKQAIKNRLE